VRSLFTLFFAAFALALLGAESGPTPSAVVHIASFAFHPANLTVQAGEVVTFVNDDSVAHTATAADKSFDSANLDANAKWSHRFEVAGTFQYICAYHPMMKGTITVKPAE